MDMNTTSGFSFSPLDIQSEAFINRLKKIMGDQKISQVVEQIDLNYQSYKNNTSFLMLASQAFKKNEDLRNEYKVLKQWVEVDPSAQAQTQLAECLFKMNDFPNALKILHHVLDDIDPKDPILFDVYKTMGNIYLKCGDIDAAEEKYNQANAIDSTNENLMVNYGVLAIQKSDYIEAKQRFAAVIQQNGACDLAWVGLALIHRHFGDMDLSRACLLRAIDENPYNKVAISHFYQWSIQDGFDPSSDIVSHYMERYPHDDEMEKLTRSLHQ